MKFIIEKPTKWDSRFFDVCDLIASWSEDRSRRVGAVIVGSANQIVSTGYNGLPRSISSSDARHNRDAGEKYYWFEHAERNAIYNAARSGVSVENCSIYSSIFPCADCTRAIIQSGIARLNTTMPPEEDQKFGRSFEVALEMLGEAGTELHVFERIAIK